MSTTNPHNSTQITIGASDEEPKFDLAQIGIAFTQAITYVNGKKYPNLDADARAWFIDAATDLMNKLKGELETLHQNKDDHTKLPGWALDPEAELRIITIKLPHILLPYQNQLVSSIEKLLAACGLNAHIRPPSSGIFLVRITFPEAGLRMEGNGTMKEIFFDGDFKEKVFGAVKNMKIEA